MESSRLNRFWTLVIIILVIAIAAGGTAAWLRYRPEQPVEISLPPDDEQQGQISQIYIDGAVNSPGIYPLFPGDSLEGLLRAAGGVNGSADLSGLFLRIPDTGTGQNAQKIDINRADAWLLEALPGIGETLAGRIVDYRNNNGPFRNTGELLKVNGIGDDTYGRIKNLITVTDW